MQDSDLRRGVSRRAAVLAALAGLSCPALARARGGPVAPVPGLAPVPGGVVQAIGSDGALNLKDRRRVRLAALRLPDGADLPKGASAGEHVRVAALTDAVRAWLDGHAVGRSVALWTPGLARDRHGRVLAHVVTAAGLWVQGGLIDAGMARVATMPGAAAGAASLLNREAAARLAGHGLWRDPLYRPRTPAETWPWLGTFQVVRGPVRAAARVRGRVYLNFGADWRREFTVMVDRPGSAGFRVADLLDLQDQFIQVRGWLFPTNGPMIALDHPAALETRVIL
jgi:endonuclease YncB( thermonuclease family)